MSDDSIAIITLGVPFLWFVLLFVALLGVHLTPGARGWGMLLGVLLGMGAGSILGFIIGGVLAWYVSRDEPRTLAGLIALAGLVLGILPGGVIGAVLAWRWQRDAWYG